MKKHSMIQAQSNQGQQNSVVEFTTQICSLIGKKVIKVQCCRVYNTDLLAHWERSYQSASSPKHNLSSRPDRYRIFCLISTSLKVSAILTVPLHPPPPPKLLCISTQYFSCHVGGYKIVSLVATRDMSLSWRSCSDAHTRMSSIAIAPSKEGRDITRFTVDEEPG
jgi:hypothetical protein